MIKKQKITFPKHIKQGDIVKILSGSEKGKIGEIIRILKATNQVVVKEANIKKKNVKPKKEGEVGKISQFEAPIHSSNVMLYSKESNIASRVCYQKTEEGKKVRIFKKLLSKN
jgi:large subunit ribosomal protein L24